MALSRIVIVHLFDLCVYAVWCTTRSFFVANAARVRSPELAALWLRVCRLIMMIFHLISSANGHLYDVVAANITTMHHGVYPIAVLALEIVGAFRQALAVAIQNVFSICSVWLASRPLSFICSVVCHWNQKHESIDMFSCKMVHTTLCTKCTRGMHCTQNMRTHNLSAWPYRSIRICIGLAMSIWNCNSKL